eukprot:5132492-Pyramimonas_sp.AAC.1
MGINHRHPEDQVGREAEQTAQGECQGSHRGHGGRAHHGRGRHGQHHGDLGRGLRAVSGADDATSVREGGLHV